MLPERIWLLRMSRSHPRVPTHKGWWPPCAHTLHSRDSDLPNISHTSASLPCPSLPGQLQAKGKRLPCTWGKRVLVAASACDEMAPLQRDGGMSQQDGLELPIKGSTCLLYSDPTPQVHEPRYMMRHSGGRPGGGMSSVPNKAFFSHSSCSTEPRATGELPILSRRRVRQSGIHLHTA